MRPLVLIPALLLTVLVCSAADEAELAVVVNKATAAETISSGDLRLMILGEKSKWPDGKRVAAVQTPPASPERALLLKAVYKMSDAVLKRYYMHAAFTGTDVALPRDVASADALKQFVAVTPGAIGCILASEVDPSVKVLKVDGSAPGEPGYKLR
jgi:ABC-type phosphate transport system substrate-binding protein